MLKKKLKKKLKRQTIELDFIWEQLQLVQNQMSALERLTAGQIVYPPVDRAQRGLAANVSSTLKGF